MKLFGHNFLASDYKGGDPVRRTAAARQQNTLANIAKYIEGLGCQIVKNLTGEGRGWIISLYGSDIKPPDGVDSPWEANMIDQFRVKRVAAQDAIYVYGGIYRAMYPLYNTGAPGGVTWGAANPGADDLSNGVTITDGQTLKVYAVSIDDPPPDGNWESLHIIALDSGTNATTAIQNWLDGMGAGSSTHEELLVATCVRDDTATPKISITQHFATFTVIAPITKDNIALRGGVWQYEDGDETVVVEPEAGGFTWPSGSNHDGVYSASKKGVTGAVWLKLDLSSVTPKLTAELLTADPTWAADIHWRKIASITHNADPDGDPAKNTVDVEQHHAGSPEPLQGNSGALAWLDGAADSTLGSAEKLNFPDEYENDSAVIDADSSSDRITVYRDGLYRFTIHGRRLIHCGPTYYTGSYAKIFCTVNGSGSMTGKPVESKQDGLDVAAAADSTFEEESATSFCVVLAEDDYIECYVEGSNAEVSNVQLTVEYLYPE